MITFFRSFFQSKLGIAITLAFLGLIAFAFASSDVANTGTFGGVSGGDRVAVVGAEKIGTSELATSANAAVNSLRQQDPTISMPAFVAQGGLEQVLDQLIERASLTVFAERLGLRAGTNLVNSEIISIPGFRGPSGEFSEDIYRQALAQQNLTDEMVREDFRAGLFVRQMLVPAAFGGRVPDKIAARYAALSKERRKGAIAVIPATAFAPKTQPTDAQLATYYRANRNDYIRPERRVLRYVTFGDDTLGPIAAPTEREIAARYSRDKSQYSASESRTITQLIVPTQQAAQSIRQRVQAGGSLDAAAQQAGLQTTTLGPVTRAQLRSQSSAAVAQSIFAAPSGTVAVPARSGLGFHVARIDTVTTTGGQTLAQVRGEIVSAITAEKRRAALNTLAERVEEQVDNGESLADIAGELRTKVIATKPVTAAGQIYGEQGRVSDVLAPALQTAFQMEEEDPQLAEIEPGKTFLAFEVTDIVPSAAAPLKEIRERAVLAWQLSEGSKRAKQAADRVMKRVDGGASLLAALRAEKIALPAPETIDLSREQLGQGQQVPPAVALLFSMAETTTKRLEAPQNAGWFVVRLDDIEAGKIANGDPQLAQIKSELNQTMAREFSDQLRKAIEESVGVERNQAAIDAVRQQLTGSN